MPDTDRLTRRLFISVLIIWSAAVLLISWHTGIQHDYGYYLQQWSLVLQGSNPWAQDQGFPPNAYGPIHNALALASRVAPLAPKLLIAVTFIGASILMAVSLLRRQATTTQLFLFLVLIPVNVVTTTVVAMNGDNDGLVAAFVGFAVLARFRRHLWLCGFFLGLAILLKYYPLLIVPFFCLDARRVNWRPLAAAGITTALGIGVAWVIWGRDILMSVSFGATREATVLSPLHAYLSHPELPGQAIATWFVGTNAVWVVLVCALGLVYAAWQRLTWIEGAAIGFFCCLIVYKVGHQQFYLAWLVLLAGVVIGGSRRGRVIVLAFVPFIVLLELVELAFQGRNLGGLPAALPIEASVGFSSGVLALATVAYLLWRIPQLPLDQSTPVAPDSVSPEGLLAHE